MAIFYYPPSFSHIHTISSIVPREIRQRKILFSRIEWKEFQLCGHKRFVIRGSFPLTFNQVESFICKSHVLWEYEFMNIAATRYTRLCTTTPYIFSSWNNSKFLCHFSLFFFFSHIVQIFIPHRWRILQSVDRVRQGKGST